MRIVAILLLLFGGVAHADPVENEPKPKAVEAEPKPEARDWHIGVEVLTDFPLYIGGQFWVEMPYRFRLSTSFGEMPDFYFDTINAVAVAAGAYNNRQAEFLSELLDHAFTWRLHAGWRPFKNHGAYFEVGYGLLEAHGSIGVLSVIQLATGFTAPIEANIGFEYRLSTLVQTVGVEVGWIWYPRSNLTVRLAFGFAATVHANVDIEPNFLSTLQRPFTQLASD
jgi:hypothetical protein